MKKYFALFFAVVFVLGFAASAFAIHAEIPAETTAVIAKSETAITLGGELRFRGEYRSNTNDFLGVTQTAVGGTNPGGSVEGAFYDMRIKFSVQAQVNPSTTAMLELMSGDASNNDNMTWGSQNQCNPAAGACAYPNSGSGATGIYKYGNTKKGDMEILQAWILNQGSGLLGIPAFVKVGHMPIKLGNGLYIDHSYYGDDAILFGIDPIKNMHITAAMVKAYEGAVAWNDDSDVYALIWQYDFEKNASVGINLSYLQQQNVGHDNSIAIVKAFPDINLWNIGINANYDGANWGVKGDFEWQQGKVKNFTYYGNPIPAYPGGIPYQDPKIGAYAFWLGGYFKLQPVKIYADAAYGSGDNKKDGKIKSFITSEGVDQHYTYVYDYRTATAGGVQFADLANTMFLRLGANAELAKNLTGDMSVYWLHATKGGFGTPELAAAGVIPRSVTDTQSKNIGWEVDANLTWQMERNWKAWVEGGYLFAGNYWKLLTPIPGQKSDAWAIRVGTLVAF